MWGSMDDITETFNQLTEAVAQRCSVKKVFLEISRISQENTSDGCSAVNIYTNRQYQTMIKLFQQIVYPYYVFKK